MGIAVHAFFNYQLRVNIGVKKQLESQKKMELGQLRKDNSSSIIGYLLQYTINFATTTIALRSLKTPNRLTAAAVAYFYVLRRLKMRLPVLKKDIAELKAPILQNCLRRNPRWRNRSTRSIRVEIGGSSLLARLRLLTILSAMIYLAYLLTVDITMSLYHLAYCACSYSRRSHILRNSKSTY